MNADRPGDNGSLRTDRYDFERLEGSIEYLIKDHERLNAEREALLSELIDREHRITHLEARLEGDAKRRAAALESVDLILERLEKVEAGLVEASGESDR
jgi:hypothetical protein